MLRHRANQWRENNLDLTMWLRNDVFAKNHAWHKLFYSKVTLLGIWLLIHAGIKVCTNTIISIVYDVWKGIYFFYKYSSGYDNNSVGEATLKDLGKSSDS